MQIGGLQKLSLIDYPGTPAAVIFTQGCNMLCPYCHNPQLVYPYLFEKTLNENEVLYFLKKRQGLLKGVVITGGEPTLQNDLFNFIKKIKNLKFLVKLDTNGTNPKILQELIREKLIDFVAMDIKSSAEKYKLFFKGNLNLIMQSLHVIKSSDIAHIFRTTYDTDILNKRDLDEIKATMENSEYIVQKCRKQFNSPEK
ncbi:anaerobic ribonucleoside-triphosphate reductase activating protein [Endomicrobiia bacterium]|nr:anaerobic ribonucleoside-triphosphate reductase activating protein [Endomicrobiia bacterium]GHT09624.1 anaerobic ribonucleoside-triphosphate reductase activating protein [Endomicrobiia bacterium]GHT13407.1 anaerobic ribonucleoside-triphosphate reductase activating protein [Endomicrobiia bacterium]GHT15341.1 anaerobic ribonucleoside-triphosphate reductase activating protein [Endomicrobiia bacterium]GHT20823.1 anaerobic ribonucleoside-triphosphate reductase activating protein [Endomicrobiia ba